MNVLGIDIGTSAIKAAVVELPSLNIVGEVANVDYEFDRPRPDSAEVSAERLWKSVVQAVRSIPDSNRKSIEGIGLSALTPALCLLGSDDRPLGPFWIHADRRSRPQARRVLDDVGDEFLYDVGTRPLPGGISALSWMCRIESEPYLGQQVRRYLHVNGWATLHMTGQTAFDPANASFSGLFGTLTDQKWSPRWCDYFHVDRNWLPEVQDGTTTIGQLRDVVAEELGVNPGVLVKLGTADTTCGLIAGRCEIGDLYHTVGTTQVLATLTNQPNPDAQRLTRHFGVGQSYLHVTHNPVGGAALDWVHKLCFRDQSSEDFFDKTIPSLLDRRSTIRLDPPFLGGDRLQIDEVSAGFQNVSLSHSREDFVTAVLTAMREHHHSAVSALNGPPAFRRIVLSGGAAPIIRQLIPDYQKSNVSLLEEGAVRGAAGLFAL